VLFKSVPPQQLLGYKLVKTIKENDFSSFKALFSPSVIQEKFGDDSSEKMEKVFNTYKNKFKEKYKYFEEDNFYFNYQGSETQGNLYIFYNGKRNAKKTIIFENDNWLFNEL